MQHVWSTSAYLVDENIQRRVYGASLAAGHGDKSEAHTDVEPLAVARARHDLVPRALLLFGGPGRLLATSRQPSWVWRDSERRVSTSVNFTRLLWAVEVDDK